MSDVQKFLHLVEAHSSELDNLSLEVWKNPELAFKEFTACKRWDFKFFNP